jgi:hypothetical protein
VGHVSRFSSLLGVEASLARVSHSSLKTGGSKLKMDGSMRWAASNPATLHLPFSIY